MRGKFIVIEGGDGAGKDANIDLLKQELPLDSVLFVKDPGSTELGLQLREILQHGENLSLEAELFLFLASRAQLVHEIIAPALASGKHVISNRFDLSTMAYQVYGRERTHLEEPLRAVSEVARGEATPDLVIYLDIDPTVGLERAAQRKSKTTRIEAETIEFHERVRKGYLKHIGDFQKHIVIDASLPIEEVFAQVKSAVEEVIQK